MKKVLITFSRYAEAALLQVLRAALNAVTGNSIFTGIEPTPAAALVKADDYQAAMSESSTGDRTAIARKNALKKEVQALLRSWAQYVNMIAKGDPTIIAASGMPTVKPVEPTAVSVVTNIGIEQGLNPGTLDIGYKKPKGVVAVVCSYTPRPYYQKQHLVNKGYSAY